MEKDVKPPDCPYCGITAVLVSDVEIYGYPGYGGQIYLCTYCADVYVGVHKGTKKPLGTMANKELRDWRIQAHAAFDPLWKKKLALRRKQRGPDYKKVYARGSGYKWLREQMGLPKSDCHIAMFTVEQCKQVVEICNNWRNRK